MTSTEPSTEPSATTTTPEVAPSTGEALSVPGLRMRGPEGWRSRQAVSTAAANWIDLDDLVTATGETTPGLTERLPDVVVDGEPAFRLAGTEDGDYATLVGLVWKGRLVTVEFVLRPGFEDREAGIASVLASIELS